ncbi:hypothetical protein KP806_22340 [Paenibacillus sp. N4]|uniref:hypothetical protein n=1 Tax=Paenibacillus vietnamensis TaxID=2590547 RepID=UPI001CD0651D|nr:hypothetical protein [Paenibacillus vietnamensis]MCA0757804.1 hypothetical protein [Paenibacillus vietnamensis]
MSSSIRSIRGLERTRAYFPVQALTSYGSFPFRDREARLAPELMQAGSRRFKLAADSAAEWLAATREAQSRLGQLLQLVGRQLHERTDIVASLRSLSDLLNDLEAAFIRHAGQLKPELWEAVEHALLHPGAAEIGLRREANGLLWQIDPDAAKIGLRKEASGLLWQVDPVGVNRCDAARRDADRNENPLPSDSLTGAMERPACGNTCAKQAQPPLEPAEVQRLKRLLLGADGLLHTVRQAVAYGDRLKTIELLQLHVPTPLPYAAYYESMHDCRPLPYCGIILNRYI